MNVPNWITLSRLLLGTASVAALIAYQFYLQALVLFLLFSGSDLLDGYLARRRGEVTDFGKFLDPTSDKIFFLTVLFFIMPKVFIFDFFTLAFYEFCLFAASCIALFFPQNRFVKLGANKFGKIKIWAEGFLILSFFLVGLGISGMEWLSPPLFFFSIIFACLSFLGHIKFKELLPRRFRL